MKIGGWRKLHFMSFASCCLGVALTSLTQLSDHELNELIREAIDEIRFFRIMYAVIWIPLFTLLLIISYINYRLYRQQTRQETIEISDNVQLVYLRKDLYEAVAKKGEVNSYINKVIEESLKKEKSA
jgi:hypothetical protein